MTTDKLQLLIAQSQTINEQIFTNVERWNPPGNLFSKAITSFRQNHKGLDEIRNSLLEAMFTDEVVNETQMMYTEAAKLDSDEFKIFLLAMTQNSATPDITQAITEKVRRQTLKTIGLE